MADRKAEILAYNEIDANGNPLDPQVHMRLVDMGSGIYAPQYAAAGTVPSGSADSGNPVKVGGVVNTATPATGTSGQRIDAWFTNTGALVMGGVTQSGADAVSNGSLIQPAAQNGTSARLTWTAASVFNGTSWDRDVKPNSTSRLLSAAASTNPTSVKASAGNLHRVRGNNANAAKRYLKFYNKATAPTVGTDTPVLTFELAASAPFDIDLGARGQFFSTGIAYAITTAAADADTGVLTAGDITCMNITYA